MDVNLSILDDIIPERVDQNVIVDERTEYLIVMDQEDIEYEVTLQGFWDDIDQRIWKSNHDRKLYEIDENNYAKVKEKKVEELNNQPPAFLLAKPSIVSISKDIPSKRRKTE
jgi:hypothetical protein